MTGRFAPRDPADLLRLIETHPLAWVVSAGEGAFRTSILPMLAETRDGALTALFGHIPLANPQTAILRERPRALFLFQGPHAYVSPGIVSKPDWAPTWNFTVAAVTADVEFVPAETDESLRRIAAHMERDRPEPWTVERMGPRYAELSAQVIGFRAHVQTVEARFKHGQDELPWVFDEIVAGIGEPALADWMARSVRG